MNILLKSSTTLTTKYIIPDDEKQCMSCSSIRHVSFLRRLSRLHYQCIIPCIDIVLNRGVVLPCKKCGKRKYHINLTRVGIKSYQCKIPCNG